MQNQRCPGAIRLPASGRARHAYLKLLSRVDPDAETGFGFEGSLLHPGAWATPAQLRPSTEYPETPVLLEYTSILAAGRRRADSLYVLWRWACDRQDWQELGRAVSVAWEWAVDLRPLAIRALAEVRSGEVIAAETTPDLPAMASQIAVFVDEQLGILAPPDRVRLLAILHDEFASRLSA